MTFASPIWLTALLPWAGVVVYLLLGRRRGASVPFLNLWRGSIQAPRVQRSMQRLPAWIVLLLIATATSIFAASAPRIANRSAALPVPSRLPSSLGIEALNVRGNQAMIRVLNQSTLAESSISLAVDGTTTLHPIDLPPVGESRNYFIDVPPGASRVQAALAATGGGPSGGSVEVDRQRSWPIIETLSPLPVEVRRMIDVYTKRRPVSETSRRLEIVAGSVTQLGDEPGIAIADASSGGGGGTLTIVAHPVTATVPWADVLSDAKVAGNPPADSTPVVSIAGRPIVAVSDQPIRQVWIGFDSPSFPRSPAFVIFWTNLLDWAGQGGDTFQPLPGTMFATHLPIAPAPPKMWYTLSPWLALTAVGLSALALAVAPKRIP